MSTELAPPTPPMTPARAAAGKSSLKRMARQSLLSAARAGTLIPKVVDRIEEKLTAEGEIGMKDLIMAGSYLERLAQHRAQVAKAAGLGKHLSQAEAPRTLVNIQFNSELPLADRIKAIQAEVRQIPLLQPASLEAVPASVEAATAVAAPQPDPEPSQPSKTAPRASGVPPWPR